MNIGFCGLDRARAPLRGDEIRSCWEPLVTIALDEDAAPPHPIHATSSNRPDLNLLADLD